MKLKQKSLINNFNVLISNINFERVDKSRINENLYSELDKEITNIKFQFFF